MGVIASMTDEERELLSKHSDIAPLIADQGNVPEGVPAVVKRRPFNGGRS
jgi:hypothetical protein